MAKRNGGKVYVTIAPNGETGFHEGYLPVKEVRKAEAMAKGEPQKDKTTPRPELTKAAQNYADLHRHAAVQAALVASPDLAMKVVAAHIVAGSSLWSVKADPRRAEKPEIAASVEQSTGHKEVKAERLAVLALLGLEDNDGDALIGRSSLERPPLEEILEKMCSLTVAEVQRILAYAMGETLAAGSEIVDTLGARMNVSLSQNWQADTAFLNGVANKDTLKAMVADIGVEETADAHKDSTARTIRSVILQFATGEGRKKVEGWVPPHLQFPQKTYAQRVA